MTYKILSLDGGGPWALIQACVLADLYPGESGHQILGHFDLAIANSGGSLILAGLIKNLQPNAIRDLFLTQANRDQIFVRTGLLEYLFDKTLGLGPKWDTEAKLAGLTALMNTAPTAIAAMRMSAAPRFVQSTTGRKLQIIISAFDYDLSREVFFCGLTSPLSNVGAFEPTIAGAVHASTNAPVNYFDGPAIVQNCSGPGSRRFWDGGVGGYNNPVLHGVVEALHAGEAPANIAALTLGTGTIWQPLGKPQNGESTQLFRAADDPSTLGDAKKMAECILDDPPDAATLNAHVISGASNPKPRIVRLSPWIAPQLGAAGWTLPAGFAKFTNSAGKPIHQLDAFATLRDMPMDADDQESVELLYQLAQQWIAGNILNQGIQTSPDSGAPVIGFADYPAGKRAWLAI